MAAIVFDFDGVIVDSEPAHARALAAAVRLIGVRLTHEQFLATCLGVGDRACLETIARGAGLDPGPGQIDELLEAKRAAFAGEVESGGVRLIDATAALMRAARGVCPIAVCSGSRRSTVEPVLRRFGLFDLCSAVVTSDDVERTKPDPEPYTTSARRLGVAAAACVAVEDTPVGIRSALGAGCRVVAVCHSLPGDRLAGAHEVHADSSTLTVAGLLAGVSGAR